MTDWLTRVIRNEAKQLISLAAEDEELRAELRAIAAETLAGTENTQVEARSACLQPDPSAPNEQAEERGQITTGDEEEPLRELTLGKRAAAGGDPVAAPVWQAHRGDEHDELA